MLVIKAVPADHDTQICCLGPTLNYILILHIFMGYIAVILDPGVVYYPHINQRYDSVPIK